MSMTYLRFLVSKPSRVIPDLNRSRAATTKLLQDEAVELVGNIIRLYPQVTCISLNMFGPIIELDPQDPELESVKSNIEQEFGCHLVDASVQMHLIKSLGPY